MDDGDSRSGAGLRAPPRSEPCDVRSAGRERRGPGTRAASAEGARMSGAGRGVTPGAEPDAGSDREAGSPAVDQAQTVHSDHGPAGDSGPADVPPENEASASAGSAGGAGAAG